MNRGTRFLLYIQSLIDFPRTGFNFIGHVIYLRRYIDSRLKTFYLTVDILPRVVYFLLKLTQAEFRFNFPDKEPEVPYLPAKPPCDFRQILRPHYQERNQKYN